MKRQVIAALLRAGRPDLANVVAQSCPLRTRMYGGLPDGGGFEGATELEVGMRESVEAVHCILGSLGRNTTGRKFEWNRILDMEAGHIYNEYKLVEKYQKEYSRPLYVERINADPTARYARKTAENIRSIGVTLKKTCERMKGDVLAQRDVPEPVMNAAVACYDYVIALMSSAVKAFEPWPGTVSNPFATTDVRTKLSRLGRTTKTATLKNWERFAADDEARERELQRQNREADERRRRRERERAEQEKRARERKPRQATPEDQRLTDEIMDLLGGL